MIKSLKNPTISIDSQNKFVTLFFNEKEFILDFIQFTCFFNSDKKFILDSDEIYPYYLSGKKSIDILEFLFKFKKDNVEFEFKNSNQYDLRSENVCIKHFFDKTIRKHHHILNYQVGHYNKNGKEAFIMKNPLWFSKDTIFMYCDKEAVCLLCPKSYQKILDYQKDNKITFYKCSNGYIGCHFNNLYIHQIIMNCYGNGKGTKNISVDHIDQNPLNNTWSNLRIASQKTQQENTNGVIEGTKRKRSKTAQPLPPGITQESIPKYVHYYSETMHKGTPKECRRDFFKVEHPSLEKSISTSKSTKVSIFQKLQQATQIISEITQGTYQPPIKQLPTYVQLKKIKEKSYLIFDKREGSQRLNLKMVLPESYQLEEQIKVFSDKIINKYNLNILT